MSGSGYRPLRVTAKVHVDPRLGPGVVAGAGCIGCARAAGNQPCYYATKLRVTPSTNESTANSVTSMTLLYPNIISKNIITTSIDNPVMIRRLFYYNFNIICWERDINDISDYCLEVGEVAMIAVA